jgi:hypothetical protein
LRKEFTNRIKIAFVALASLPLATLATVQTARARDFKFKADASGSVSGMPFHFTTNPAEGTGIGTLTGKSNKGKFSGVFIGGTVLTSPVPTPCTLPDGGAGTSNTVLGSVVIFRFDSKGDQLFGVSPSGGGTECDGTAGPPTSYDGTLRFSITGGTGRFAGASGTLTEHYYGQYLVFLTEGGIFGWVADQFSGTITTP